TSNPNQAPSTTTTTVTNAQLHAMIDQGVNAALAARDANRTGDDSHTSGMGIRRTERVTQECTYQDFMKCQPLYFKGTKGVVELTQWFERMETVFRISNCLAENQVKFATCTLLAGALTWWNSHVRIIELKKKMADKYYPRNEMKKIETKLWNLEVQGTDLTRSPTNANVANNQRGNGAGQKVTCYECGAQGHFKRDCPKLKTNNNNNNRGNQVGTGNAQTRVYAVGNAGTNPDANTVTGTLLLNNCYASVVFDTGADRSFVSTAFSSQFDIAP
nr:hypothetical protein [Tanacetum cinerariifolium]